MFYESDEARAKYEAWLSSLKEGDRVCVKSRGLMDTRIEVFLVKKITDKRIKLVEANEGAYAIEVNRQDGHLRGSHRYECIEPLTETIRELIRRNVCQRRIRLANVHDWKRLSTEQLTQIAAWLEAAEAKASKEKA